MVNKVTRTAPERIWLQVSDEREDCAESFPDPAITEITWHYEPVTDCEVEYIRADLITTNNRCDAFRAALEEIYDLAGWQSDDNAEENNTTPEDMTSHINGLIRQKCNTALQSFKE